ncbi:MAG: hypothetical protein JWP12_3622 [Bacteroidetes bacterium]|nr:hypothetical protein [Bacteroidota bacterium]
MKIFKPFNHSNHSGTKFFFYSLFIGCSMLQAQKSTAQTVSLTTPGTPYTQNFDALVNTAGSTTNTLTIQGWYLTETGGGARDNEQYAVDNGGSTTGDTYGYGTTASTDRAIGGLRSGTLIPNIGASFTNNTGAAITSMDISYTGEEWRLGTAGRTDTLNFEYSLNAASLTTGTWTALSTLNFITPNTVTTGAKDGNATANRTALSATISALSIPDGTTFWIRWTDIDVTGADDGLAVDDFSLTAFSTVTPTNPEMDVLGNGVSIANNDATPSIADSTDFGNQSVCTGSISHTFTIANTGTADLTLSGTPHVVVSGPAAADFTVSAQPATPITAAGTTTFTVVFDPSVAGARIAVLSIDNNDSDENPYVFSVQGTGVELSTTLDAQTNVSCNGGSNGVATVGASSGTPSYSYSWAPSGGTAATASGITAGTYTCTISDAGGCSQTQTVTITEPSAIAFTADTHTDVSCNGGSNATAAVTTAAGGTGTFTYDWAPGTPPGDGTIAITGLNAGSYTCTATDNNGCTATAGITISEPTVLTAATAATSTILCNGGTADISVTATGGTGTYTGTGSFNVSAGTYNYTVTDINGCSATTGITVTEPAALVASASSTTIFCNGQTTDITLTATGGTIAYTGIGTFTENAGTYNYTITDANGCTDATSITVTEPALISASQTVTLCSGGVLTVGVFTHTVDGTYTDTIPAPNGCDSIVTSNLTINAAIDASTSLSGNTITATLSGASAYQWIDCNNGNASLTGETAQSYTASADGNFAVVITVGSCSDTSSCVAIVGTGIHPASADNKLTVYPNPANDVVTVQIENVLLNRSATLSLYNTTGQLISETRISKEKTEIDLSSLPKGIYFIRLQDEHNVITKKITKQ